MRATRRSLDGACLFAIPMSFRVSWALECHTAGIANLSGRQTHTVVFGLGTTGFSCVRFLARDRSPDGHRYTHSTAVCGEKRAPNTRAVELILGDATPDRFVAADRIVVSPGLRTSSCLLELARARGIPLVSDIELFLAHARAPVIGVTGTNGKSTVTALTGELLRGAGMNVGVGGNLGEAALDLLDAARDAYVVELSSFQLERLNAGRFQIAANLNVTPDHLDRYPDMAAYAASKQRIFVGCDVAIYNRADALTRPKSGRGISIGLDAPESDSWGIVEQDGRRFLASGHERLLAVDELGIRGRPQ